MRPLIELCIRAIVIIALTSLAIWDVEVIIEAYVRDNRLTLVKLTSITDEYPFLEDVTIKFERVGEDTVFLETIGMSDDEIDNLFDLRLSRWYQKPSVRSPRHVRDGPRNVSLADRVHLGIVSELLMLSDMGEQSIGEMQHKQPNEHLQWALEDLNASEIHQILENFLNDPAVDDMINQTWQELEQEIIHAWSHRHVPLYNMFARRLIFNIDLGPFISPLQEINGLDAHASGIFYFDAIPNSSMRRIENLSSTIDIMFPSLNHRVINKPGKTSATRVTITNMGVYDRSRTADCTNDYTSEKQCRQEEKARAKAKKCGCISFTERRFFAKDDRWSGKPFCTPKHYEHCLEEYRKVESAIDDDMDLCTPCKAFKNVYLATTFSATEPFCPHDSTLDCYRAQVEFACGETFFVEYEERAQLGLSQLISQIGGDLGLYIGFSLIGVLELILFLVSVVKRRRAMHGSNEGMMESISWIDVISTYFSTGNANSGDFMEMKMRMEKKIYRLEEALRKANWEVSKMSTELGQVKDILRGRGISFVLSRSKSMYRE